VTRCTAVARRSRSSSVILLASRCTRPAPKVSRAACGMRRYWRLWPVAGASTTIASHAGPPPSLRVASYQIFPTVISSFSPGAPEGEHGVGAAEAEGVGERGVDAGGPRLARDVVQVAGLVRLLEVDGRRQDAARQREHGVGRLDRARRAEQVPGHRLGRADRE